LSVAAADGRPAALSGPCTNAAVGSSASPACTGRALKHRQQQKTAVDRPPRIAGNMAAVAAQPANCGQQLAMGGGAYAQQQADRMCSRLGAAPARPLHRPAQAAHRRGGHPAHSTGATQPQARAPGPTRARAWSSSAGANQRMSSVPTAEQMTMQKTAVTSASSAKRP